MKQRVFILHLAVITSICQSAHARHRQLARYEYGKPWAEITTFPRISYPNNYGARKVYLYSTYTHTKESWHYGDTSLAYRYIYNAFGQPISIRRPFVDQRDTLRNVGSVLIYDDSLLVKNVYVLDIDKELPELSMRPTIHYRYDSAKRLSGIGDGFRGEIRWLNLEYDSLNRIIKMWRDNDDFPITSQIHYHKSEIIDSTIRHTPDGEERYTRVLHFDSVGRLKEFTATGPTTSEQTLYFYRPDGLMIREEKKQQRATPPCAYPDTIVYRYNWKKRLSTVTSYSQGTKCSVHTYRYVM